MAGKPKAKSVRAPRKRPLPAFLKSGASAYAWGLENCDIDPGDGSPEEEYYQDLAWDYSSIALGVERAGTVRIYRTVAVPATAAERGVRLDCLGKAWSFKRQGAGVYNQSAYAGRTVEVTIVAVIDAGYVDWEYGFTSYLSYPDQWEISVLQHAPVLVESIGPVKYDPPLQGNSGAAHEDWSQGCG